MIGHKYMKLIGNFGVACMCHRVISPSSPEMFSQRVIGEELERLFRGGRIYMCTNAKVTEIAGGSVSGNNSRR